MAKAKVRKSGRSLGKTKAPSLSKKCYCVFANITVGNRRLRNRIVCYKGRPAASKARRRLQARLGIKLGILQTLCRKKGGKFTPTFS